MRKNSMDIIKKVFLCSALLASTFMVVSIEKKIITGKQYQRASQFALLDPNYDRKKIVVNKVIDSKPSRYISFITDGEKNRYVIKQKRSGGVRKQFQVIFEEVSGHIAEKVGVLAHQVKTLPAGMAFQGKILTDRAASILTLVPGIPVGDIADGPYANIDMRQSNRPDWPQEKLGLNKKVIASMSLHPDLARMGALHTFLAIKSCGPANYFYDKTDSFYEGAVGRFYAIDMDKAYNSNDDKELISKIACDQIRLMLRTKKVFKQNQLEGLTLYKDTLQQLVDLFPPGRIHALMDEFSAASGFKKAYLPEIASRVEHIKDAVTRSHQHILELIDLLSKLIRKNSGVRRSNLCR